MLRLGSLFSGSGGFELGATLSGITPIFSAEVEPFPIRVTTKRFPNITHYGDVSKLNGAEVPPVDIITFGSPCQDMSVAGKRRGLDGERSGLFYQAVRIVKEMRCKTNGKYPRFVVWENVPGVFSSNKGEDFKAVLEALCKIKTENASVPRTEKGKWENAGLIMAEGFSLAWRVLDAQYFGVPQRRRRIYLVADFDGECAGKILFESEGLSGYSSPGGCSWKRVAGAVESGAGETSTICLNDQGGERMDVTEDVTNTLRAEAHHPPLVFENHSQDSRYVEPLETAQTVLATYRTGGNNQPFVVETPKTLKIRAGCEGGGKGALVQDTKSATLACNNNQTVFVPKVYGICAKDSNSMKSSNPHSGIYEADTTRTLDANGGNPCCNQGGMAVVSLQDSMIGREDKNGPQGDGINEDISFTLNTVDKHAVAYGIDRAAFNQGENAKYDFAVAKGVEPTIAARDFKDPPAVNDVNYIVRRLTPTECARLQGFPDWWCSGLGIENPTDEDLTFWREVFETFRKVVSKAKKPKTDKQIVKWLKAPHSDSAEYKMWGNGIALPCVCFVLSGIVWAAENI